MPILGRVGAHPHESSWAFVGYGARVQIHLVDGTYELFRAFFGAPEASAPDGLEVGATRGLARSLLALVTREGATHVAVAFDHVIESFRNDLFDGYKTGEGIEPTLWAQFPLAEQICEALGFVTWPMVQFEADDAIAAGAHRYAGAPGVDQVRICSPDKDLCQCVREGQVVSVDRRREKVLDVEGVKEKFGVSPESIPDWLALVGDAADGIPGIPKWGAKSSATVLAEYGHIEAIPSDSGAWSVKVRGAKGLSESLEASREAAALYKTLATLRTDVPLDEDVADLEWRGADRDRLAALCERLGDERLMARVPRFR